VHINSIIKDGEGFPTDTFLAVYPSAKMYLHFHNYISQRLCYFNKTNLKEYAIYLQKGSNRKVKETA
jgi:hypothetical protein